jgi:hypothetical protein
MVEVEAANVSVEGLREVCRSSEDAIILFEYFAKRRYNTSETKTNALLRAIRKEGNDVRKPLVIDIFRKLENLGCGQYVEGRRGRPSRFRWAVTLTSVGKAATGRAATVDSIGRGVAAAPTDVESTEGPLVSGQETSEGSRPVKIMTHQFNLRPNYTVTLDLPSDITSVEAERLSRMILTLPFGRA